MTDPRPSTVRGPQLDETAKRIIELLQDDGRLSYSAMAKDVGLSEAAVRHRVQKLIDSGVMQVVAVTDPLQMGFARQAMVGIKVSGDVRKVAAELATMDQLDYIVITTGRFDILAELVAESDDELLDVISSRISALDQVVTTETFVYLRLEKQTYAWGVR
ncbi:Lrp/AsnC family transcriptional regulator [Aeromicrobium wangtongii]|uniref:Lrp/AsnC family transcriptional regulator n=1 Tax=Aeromicrobium wangtongii TaxID=2969247 RepID=A0ABY5M724_9ACTN|nr:Lrp/AsnC family transcriptional regulator [Aeromicrobium wangtongii]MCD9198465.1 Lrp/AsnC family transcriptional regulator [Aeromicrobium wangtongii]UUP12493.1 Lrp/AsnC family transcriptional regulator [Aeromicrobium wangtongii]